MVLPGFVFRAFAFPASSRMGGRESKSQPPPKSTLSTSHCTVSSSVSLQLNRHHLPLYSISTTIITTQHRCRQALVPPTTRPHCKNSRDDRSSPNFLRPCIWPCKQRHFHLRSSSYRFIRRIERLSTRHCNDTPPVRSDKALGLAFDIPIISPAPSRPPRRFSFLSHAVDTSNLQQRERSRF